MRLSRYMHLIKQSSNLLYNQLSKIAFDRKFSRCLNAFVILIMGSFWNPFSKLLRWTPTGAHLWRLKCKYFHTQPSNGHWIWNRLEEAHNSLINVFGWDVYAAIALTSPSDSCIFQWTLVGILMSRMKLLFNWNSNCLRCSRPQLLKKIMNLAFVMLRHSASPPMRYEEMRKINNKKMHSVNTDEWNTDDGKCCFGMDPKHFFLFFRFTWFSAKQKSKLCGKMRIVLLVHRRLNVKEI